MFCLSRRLQRSVPRRALLVSSTRLLGDALPVSEHRVDHIPSNHVLGVFLASFAAVLGSFLLYQSEEDTRLKHSFKWLSVAADLFRGGKPEFVHALLRDAELPSDPYAASLLSVARSESAAAFLRRLRNAGPEGIEVVSPGTGDVIMLTPNENLLEELSAVAVRCAEVAVALAERGYRTGSTFPTEATSWRGPPPHPRVRAAEALSRAMLSAGRPAEAADVARAALNAEPTAARLHAALAEANAFLATSNLSTPAPSGISRPTTAAVERAASSSTSASVADADASDDTPAAAARRHYVRAAFASPLEARPWLDGLAFVEEQVFKAPRRAARVRMLNDALPGNPAAVAGGDWAGDLEAVRQLGDPTYVAQHTETFSRLASDPYRCLDLLRAAHGDDSEVYRDSSKQVGLAAADVADLVKTTLGAQYPTLLRDFEKMVR